MRTMILAREMPSSRIAKKERGSLPSSSCLFRSFYPMFFRVSEYMATFGLFVPSKPHPTTK